VSKAVKSTKPQILDAAAANDSSLMLDWRAGWIIQQQRFFQNYLPKLPPRRYISGESHRYLGRQYRLRVHKGKDDCVKLARGQLAVYLVDRTKKAHIKTLVLAWYRQRAEVVFRELFGQMSVKAELE
jgi:predicted metal-dependent hydrolase